jgi:hypothetical protein
MARRGFTAIAFIALLAIAALSGRPLSVRAGAEHPLSPAQIALFESDHLAEIRSPATLDYTFRHDGSEPYEDRVAIVLGKVHDDGSKDVSVEFLTGEHRMEFSPVARFHGNPLIMYFLEWDVRRMHETTGGSNLYFRNRIREAFVEQAEIDHTSITFDGRPQPAIAITLQPYRHDPGIERYAAFRDKSYRFVLSDAVPGKVYEIEASLPADGADAAVAIDRVTYKEIRE